MTRLEKIFPVAVVVVFGGWFASKAVPPAPGPDGVDYAAVGRLPVRESGRVMPLDSLARTSLQAISGRTEVVDEHGKVVASAVEWLVKVMDSRTWDGGPAADYPVFRIDNDQLLAALELPRKPGFFRYSIREIMRNAHKVEAEFQRVEDKREKGRALDLLDAKVQDLGQKLQRYQKLAQNQIPQAVPPAEPGGEWVTFSDVDRRFQPTDEQEEEARTQAFEVLKKELTRQFGDLNKVPPEFEPEFRRLYRMQLGRELGAIARTHRGDINPAAGALTRVLQAARDGRGEDCKKALAEYEEKYLGGVSQLERQTARIEAEFLGQMAPFYHAAFLYLFVIVLSACAWLGWSGPLGRAAFYLAVFTFAVHTAALLLRMYVQGRPPVTNLYASAVFIGWGSVGLCLILERMFKNGIGSFVAGVAGAATLEIAHFLGGSGDTMALLQAVLDTNFWLAVHVTTVTLGYTATFVAGVIAIVYIARGVLTPSLTPSAEKTLGQMIYGVVCFATLLSFFGTVAGGIWADYSWGRFWGWDPKENGAVMIVIWNTLILHARWGGMVKNRGMAVLAVFGNIITAWSWFGTNQLQIGLHSYGFDNRLATGCRWFWVGMLVVIAVGLIPRQYWWSSRAAARPAPAPTAYPVSGPRLEVIGSAAGSGDGSSANGRHDEPSNRGPARKGGKRR